MVVLNRRPLHVLYTIPMFSQQCEGTYARFHDAIQTLQRMENPPWRYSVVPLMRYYGPPAANVFFRDGPPAAKLARYLRNVARLSRQVDVVHMVEGHFPYSLLTWLLVPPGVPMVVGPNITVGTTPDLILRHLYQAPTPSNRLRLRLSLLRHAQNKIVFHRRSPLLRRFRKIFVFQGYRPLGVELGGMDEGRMVNLPPGVRTDLFRPEGEAISFGAPFAILYIGDGRRPYLKGLDVFLEALARLVRSDLPFKAILLGRESEAMAQRIGRLGLQEHVEQRGWVARADLAPYYRGADVFVCASRFETGAPTTSLEALACGTPVIASDRPNMAGTLSFRAGDPGDLAARLLQLYERRQYYRRQALAETARWDIRRVIDCFHAVYQEVCGRG